MVTDGMKLEIVVIEGAVVKMITVVKLANLR